MNDMCVRQNVFFIVTPSEKKGGSGGRKHTHPSFVGNKNQLKTQNLVSSGRAMSKRIPLNEPYL